MLFNDGVMVTKKRDTKKKNHLELTHNGENYPFSSDSSIEAVRDDSEDLNNVFLLKHSSGRTLFSAPTNALKEKWITLISIEIKKYFNYLKTLSDKNENNNNSSTSNNIELPTRRSSTVTSKSGDLKGMFVAPRSPSPTIPPQNESNSASPNSAPPSEEDSTPLRKWASRRNTQGSSLTNIAERYKKKENN